MKRHRIAPGLLLLALSTGLLGASGHVPAGATAIFDPSKLVLRQSFPDIIIAPVGFANAGDGSNRLFVLDQSGKIRLIKNGVLQAAPFLDISTRVYFDLNCCSERGLLALTFHPQYASNGWFFVMYTEIGAGSLQLSRFGVSPGNPDQADPTSELSILTIPHPTHSNHNGGTLAFGPDTYLYWTTGDGGGGGDTLGNAQNLNSLLGKVLRIDVDSQDPGKEYAIPAGNPFVETPVDNPDTRAEIWAYGLRNPWRASFDRLTGDLWIGDVGQGDWEEIDFQSASSVGGENYGWNVLEGAHCYPPDSTCSDPPAYVPPVAEYNHTIITHDDNGCSIVGGYRYRGARYPDMQGQYFYGDLCSGFLYALSGDPGSGWSTQLLPVTRTSLTTFGEDEAGHLYLTDYGMGKIYRLCYIGGAESCAADTLGVHVGSTFFLRNSLTPGLADITVSYGWAGATPLAGDWDGNATRTVGINSDGWYFLRNANSAGAADLIFQYGWAGATPLVGDWDGNGTTTPGIYSDGWFFLKNSNAPGPADLILQFGWAGATPLVGDWDGNGTTTVGIYSTGTFFLRNSNTPGSADLTVGYGPASGVAPIVGDWDGNDTTTVGIYSGGTFFVRNTNTPGSADLTVGYGFAGAVPLTGDWDGLP